MVAGLALVGVTAQNVAPSAGLIDPTRPFSYRPPLAVSILQIISLPAIPLGMLVGLIGVLLFVGTSPVARWGVALAAVATLLLIVEPFVTYVFWFGSNGASPGYGTITAMFFLTRAVSVLSSLVLAAGIVCCSSSPTDGTRSSAPGVRSCWPSPRCYRARRPSRWGPWVWREARPSVRYPSWQWGSCGWRSGWPCGVTCRRTGTSELPH